MRTAKYTCSPSAVSGLLCLQDSWPNWNGNTNCLKHFYTTRWHKVWWADVDFSHWCLIPVNRLNISLTYHLLTKSWNSELNIPGSFGGGWKFKKVQSALNGSNLTSSPSKGLQQCTPGRSHTGRTHLIDNVIKQLKNSHRRSAVRSVCWREG